jgi:hypothetical protein
MRQRNQIRDVSLLLNLEETWIGWKNSLQQIDRISGEAEHDSRLYLATRSDLQGAPVLISPVLKATAKSAM